MNLNIEAIIIERVGVLLTEPKLAYAGNTYVIDTEAGEFEVAITVTRGGKPDFHEMYKRLEAKCAAI